MRINHNIAALNTYNKLSANSAATQGSLEKLSSGLKINKAGDDAAGLAISEKMRGQIRGLDMASKNAQDGISLIQTAEGALNETHSILQRMRELAVQSSNDTNTDADRKNIQDELTQLTDEIDRISDTTQFNTKSLIDGSMGGANNAAVANINKSAVLKEAGAVADADTVLTTLQDKDGNSLGIKTGDKITVSYVTNDGEFKSNSLDVADDTAVSDLTALIAEGNATVDANGSINVAAKVAGTTTAINGISINVEDSNGATKSAATKALSSFEETTSAENVRTDGSATLHIGANTGQNLNLSINDMGSSALGVKGLQVSTQNQADVAIKVIDNATQKVSAERSKLGAVQNRLDHTINNLGTSSENLTAAESRIRDVDMASEMMEFTKNNILSQAAQSMLAQANQQPQGVLQLLQ